MTRSEPVPPHRLTPDDPSATISSSGILAARRLTKGASGRGVAE